MLRAYSVLDVKSIDGEKRTFSGLATSPALDRMSDRVDPMKAKFASEIPLLHAHDSRSPIGVVRLGKPTKAGIPFQAEIPVIHEPPSLKERVDVAWAEIVHGLVRAVSIGFRATENPTFNDKGGVDFGEIEILETSTVSIPAQSEALIHTIKSIDAVARAAAGVDDSDNEIRSIDSATLALTGKEQADEVDLTGAKLVPATPPEKVVHVAKLSAPARDRADPFVIRKIRHTG